MRRLRGRWRGRAAVPGSIVLVLVVAVSWFKNRTLHSLAGANPAAVPAVLAGLPVMLAVMGGALWLEYRAMGRAWSRRAEALAGLSSLSEPAAWLVWLRSRPDHLDWLSRPLLDTPWGRNLAERWYAAGFDAWPSRFLLLMAVAAVMGWMVGARIAGPILAAALAATPPFVPAKWVDTRAKARQRKFDKQIPVALYALASGLAAGLSFPQAIGFSAGELPPPISKVLARMEVRLRLGLSMEHALEVFLESVPGEMVALAVEGIQLERQYGGDLVRMLGETADLLRMRLELEREVRAVTTQGRLSGAVVAGLVPVSAALLLTTNPSYIDVLLETLPGQGLLVVALLLQIIGWAILGRLVRIQY